ncbi:DUF6297 family protein [Actinopolymorpha sp. B11F2]|uniref:DUF6297 family protein n=1 Tax=Actinopolymorpha sp. B11F2 TaxID=3160862 RepID=UPI0032E50588
MWQALEAAYLYAFAVFMVGSIAAAAIVGTWRELSACAGDCSAEKSSLFLLFSVALAALWFRGLLSMGPLVGGRATATFLLSTPMPRGPLLRGRAFALLCAGLLLGAGVSSALTSIASGPSVLAGVAGAVCGLFLTGLAILGQPHAVLGRTLRLISDIVLAVLVAAVPLVLARVLDPAQLLPGLWPAQRVAMAVLGLAAIGVVVAAVRSLPAIPRRDLVAGGDLLEGLSGAAASLDTSLISDLLHYRRFRRLGARRSWQGRGRGLAAMAYREALRPLRSPWRLGIAAALVLLQYAAVRVGLPTILPVAAAVGGYLAVRPLGAGLHSVERSPGLARAFPQRPASRQRAFAVPLLLGAAIWALAVTPALLAATNIAAAPGSSEVVPALSGTSTLPAYLLPALTWAALAATIGAGVVRSVTRPPVSYEGPLISTPAGVLPAGFVAQVLRGPDAVAAGSTALLLGIRPGPSSLLLLVPPVILLYLLAFPARRLALPGGAGSTGRIGPSRMPRPR